MMVFAIVTPILLIVGLLTIMLVVKNLGRVRMKKSFHRKLIAGYLVLLFLVLIVVEVMDHNRQVESPPKVSASAAGFDLRYAIDQGAPVPERLVVAKRMHEIEGKFSIPDFSRDAYILIELTPGDGHIIEETVYKPELLTGFDESDTTYYDLSDKIQIELPIWDNHSMYVPKQPLNNIRYTIYQDSNILNQFTDHENHSASVGMVSGMMTIHLKIPESIKLDINQTGDEYDTYIELL